MFHPAMFVRVLAAAFRMKHRWTAYPKLIGHKARIQYSTRYRGPSLLLPTITPRDTLCATQVIP